METLSKILTKIDSAVWGPVTLVLLVGTGVFLTFRLRFLPWRYLPKSLKAAFSPESRKTDSGEGDISPFSALMTALAGTIGTGQYRRRGNSHGARRTGCARLDVDCRGIRYFHKICGMCACH